MGNKSGTIKQKVSPNGKSSQNSQSETTVNAVSHSFNTARDKTLLYRPQTPPSSRPRAHTFSETIKINDMNDSNRNTPKSSHSSSKKSSSMLIITPERYDEYEDSNTLSKSPGQNLSSSLGSRGRSGSKHNLSRFLISEGNEDDDELDEVVQLRSSQSSFRESRDFGPMRHECELCQKTFDTPDLLDKHIQVSQFSSLF